MVFVKFTIYYIAKKQTHCFCILFFGCFFFNLFKIRIAVFEQRLYVKDAGT